MHAKVFSSTTVGIHAQLVEVEADIAMGLSNFYIVGLPDKAIKESRERVRAALKNSGVPFPDKLVTVNLAPANLKKQDILFDLPIALAILIATGSLFIDKKIKTFLEESIFLGELSLDGDVRPVCGVLSLVDYARSIGKKRVIMPEDNLYEASVIKNIELIGVKSLVQLINYIKGEERITPEPCRFDDINTEYIRHNNLDFSQVRGQPEAKRALEIGAAGNHNVLFIGPPGSGKTMLAQRLSTIMPKLSFEQVIEVTKIYSIAGMLGRRELITHRPFRSPHHTISQAGLVGGGSIPRPGEVSLSHHGVLFLDELTEFKRSTLEVLRQPLESKRVLISRAQTALEFPASFMLVAALNPCPCGFAGDPKKACACTKKQVKSYMGKLSGPLLDRIDLHVGVTSVSYEEAINKDNRDIAESNNSEEILARVEQARELQKNRGQEYPNGLLPGELVEQFCQRTRRANKLIKDLFKIRGVSMRGFHKILKIARTVADLDNAEIIEEKHMYEARMYRLLDKVTD